MIAAEQHGACANLHAFAHDTVRTDVRRRINLRRRRDDRAGVNARRRLRFGKKQRQHFRESHARIFHAQQSFLRRSHNLADENRRRPALLGLGEIILVLGERQMPDLRVIRRSEAGDLQRGIADEFGSELFSKLGGGESRHDSNDE